MNIMVGRAIAAVGVVLAFVAIWTNAIEIGSLGSSYWDTDGTIGAWLLILACLAALLLVAALATGNPMLDAALLAVGGVMWGSFAFFPATLAGKRWGWIGVGGWLGLCTALVVIGALLAYLAARREALAARDAPSRRALGAAAVAAVGLVVVLICLFLDVERGENGGTYWSPPDSGHWLGALFLVLLIGTALALAAGVAGRRATGFLVAVGLAAAVFGLAFFIVVGDAFQDLGNLDIGGWLGFVGGLVALLGAIAAWHETIRTRVRTTPAQ